MTVKASDLAYTPARAVREWAVRSARDLWLNVVGFSLTFCAAAVLAVPQPFSAWMASILRLSRPIILLKLPVAAVFAVFALLWGMRMHLALPPSALRFPSAKVEPEDVSRPAA